MDQPQTATTGEGPPQPKKMKAASDVANPEPQDATASSDKNSDVIGQQLLEAARVGDTPTVEKLLGRRGDASYQDSATGQSALMLAAGNGHAEVVSELLINGAPYNAVDKEGKCAGNYALEAGHSRIVDALVDAGVTAELLFARLAARKEERQRKEREAAPAPSEESSATTAETTGSGGEKSGSQASSAESAASAPASAMSTSTRRNQSTGADVDYFKQSVRYTDDGQQLLDSTQDAVMMEWERPLMRAHAAVMIPDSAPARTRDVLNIGFGMGIIDGFLQERQPRTHTIIEAHPTVYAECLKKGWDKKAGVSVRHGRWQDVLGQLIEAEGHQRFDAIFFDTYSEDWVEQRKLHALLPRLLKPGGVYSFFNGFCPDNVFFQGVACQVVKMELAGLGIATKFSPIPVDCSSAKTWKGVRQRYFHDDTYHLPVCTFGRSSGQVPTSESS